MANVQGTIKNASGTVQDKVLYTAYYEKVTSGGTDGPGDGSRASQFCHVVYSSDVGNFSMSVNSDNFIGAGATIANGDKVTLIFWRDASDEHGITSNTTYGSGTYPSDPSYQSHTDASGGSHPLGFKHDNGNSSVSNYEQADEILEVTYTMTGNGWTVSGEDLQLVSASTRLPTANFTGSTNVGSPTSINTNANYIIQNSSSDNQNDVRYSLDGQRIFEQSCGAFEAGHANFGGGTQTADGSDRDAVVYTYTIGTTYGSDIFAKDVDADADANTASTSTYWGPLLDENTKITPSNIDTYEIRLTVKDDAEVPNTDSVTKYFKTQWRDVSVSASSKMYKSYANFIGDTGSWHSSTGNTVDGVIRLTPNITQSDNELGIMVNPRILNADITLDGSSAFPINAVGIGTGVTAPSFITFKTQGDGGTNPATEIRHIYEITASSANQITIDTKGSTESYAVNDLCFVSRNPASGTDAEFSWEVRVSNGLWNVLGTSNALVTGAGLQAGTTITYNGIGENVTKGWQLHIVDGSQAGYYPIESVTHDNQIVLAGAGLGSIVPIGTTYKLTCNNNNVYYEIADNDDLDFRHTVNYTRGWATASGYIYSENTSASTITTTVANIDPESDFDYVTDAGNATKYLFDGGKSYGTQTTWEQDTTFASYAGTLNAGLLVITDTAIDTSTLRDNHAWLVLLDANDKQKGVYKITDIARETPDNTIITIDCGSDNTTTISVGDKFRTTNTYEIESGGAINDIQSYAWELRISDEVTEPTGTTLANWTDSSHYETQLSTGSGELWNYTFDESKAGAFCAVKLRVTDQEGDTHEKISTFIVTVSTAALGTTILEWE